MVNRKIAKFAFIGASIAMLSGPQSFADTSPYDANQILNKLNSSTREPKVVRFSLAQEGTPAAQMHYPAMSTNSRSSPPPKPKREDTLFGLLGLGSAGKQPSSRKRTIDPTPSQNRSIASVASLLPRKNEDPSFITVGGGWFDFNDDEQAVEFRIEWRGEKVIKALKPVFGFMGTTDQAAYGYGGLLIDLFFGRRFVLTPSLAAGVYFDGDGKNLGSALEFRSGLEFGYRFNNRSRLSMVVYHISNASLSDNNPGTEVFSIAYSLPLD